MRYGLVGVTLLPLLSGLLAAGCDGDPPPVTAVVVFVHAEPTVRADTDSLHVEVYGSKGRDEANDPALRRDVWLGDRGDTTSDGSVIDLELGWPVRVLVAPLDGDVSRVFRVRATALDDSNTEIGKVQVLSGYQRGEVLQILLTLEDACRGELCPEGQTCATGVCVDEWQDPDLLTPYQPDAGMPDGGVDGATPDGSTDGGSTDGGSTDGGSTDGATDACVPSAEVCDGEDNDCDGVADNNLTDTGGPCDGSDPDNCETGIWECVDGALSCTDDEEDDRKTFYLDNDGDGYGVAGADDTSGCDEPPEGYAELAGDCCDDDSRAHPGQVNWFRGNNNCGEGDFNCNGPERRLYDLTNSIVRSNLPLDQCANNCDHVQGWESLDCSPCQGECGFQCNYHYDFDLCSPVWGEMIVECR